MIDELLAAVFVGLLVVAYVLIFQSIRSILVEPMYTMRERVGWLLGPLVLLFVVVLYTLVFIEAVREVLL